MERLQYSLPNKNIITNKEMFEIEVAKKSVRNSNKIVFFLLEPRQGTFPNPNTNIPRLFNCKRISK